MRITFFFTIIPLVFIALISNAYGETGKNFDREQIQENTFKWSSHYERILDNGQWINYRWNDNGTTITFESANLIYQFNKSTCEFTLLNSITKQISINSFAHEVIVNGIKEPLSACSVLNITPSQDNLSVSVTRSSASGELKTIYSLDGIGSMEWIHEPVITKTNTTALLGVVDVCKGCVTPITLQSSITNQTLYDFGDYTLDTKNEVHGTLKSTISDKGDYIFTYEDKTTKSMGEKLIIDPTFTSNNPTEDSSIYDSGNNDNCDANALTKETGAAALTHGMDTTGSTVDCYRVFVEWNISSIPSNVIISSARFKFEISSVSGLGPDFCTYVGMNTQPSTASNSAIWTSISDNNHLVTSSALCDSIGTNKDLDLGSNGTTYIANKLSVDWAAIGIKRNPDQNLATDGSVRYSQTKSEEGAAPTPPPTLEVIYSLIPPNAVTDLIALQVTGNSVSLDWTQPSLNNGIFVAYQINYTTPWGNPQTVISNTTTTTSGTATGLTELTLYSFRVGVWIVDGYNGTGNILNVTTLKEIGIGTLNITGTNPNLIPILFERNDINDTALFLNFTYSNTFTLSCDLHYKFAQANQTYTSVSSTTISNTKHSAFQFNNVTSEIIDVFCWNQADGAMNSTNVNSTNSGRYLITQTDFLLLQQIANFKSGVYGTGGQFGILDFSTLVIIILSMVGLNRVNESVGGIFVVGIVGVAWFFGIVDLTNFIIAGIALTVLLIVGTTKKD